MKRIIIDKDKDEDTIKLSEVDKSDPVFAKQNGVLQGMVVHELSKGWILRTGGVSGATGHHPTLEGCIKSCSKYGYEFFT